MNIETLTPEELIATFVIESKGSGHFLAYEDHDIVRNWVKTAKGDTDRLLLILSEIIPAYFNRPNNNSKRLAGINRLVLSKIKTS